MKIALSSLLLLGWTLQAEVQTRLIEYRQGDAVLEGFLAYDGSVVGKRPGVLIVHQWKGLGPYEKKRAEMLAQLGYTAFAVDIYGKGIRAGNRREPRTMKKPIIAPGRP